MRIMLYLLLAAVVVSAQLPIEKQNKKVPEVGHHCMECICQASSNCNETAVCKKGVGAVYHCGAYVISWGYWHDGGKPGDRGRPRDFETCLINRTCAEEAVRGYMRRYGQDCDQSGQTDCYDFARIHKLGFGPACSKDTIVQSYYWEKFVGCYDEQKDHEPHEYELEPDDYELEPKSSPEYDDDDDYYEDNVDVMYP